MAQDENHINELMVKTKRYIKGIIESSPKQFYVEDLAREYRMLVGEQLPYRELGFSNSFDLYKSMPDVLRLNGRLVQNVPNENSAHVEKMVMEQKCNLPYHAQGRRLKNTNYLNMPYLSSNQIRFPDSQFYPVNTFYNFPVRTFVPYYVPQNPSIWNQPTQMHTHSSWNLPVKTPHIPQNDKCIIQEILSSVPNGLNFSELQQMFSGKIGRNLNPHFYGYNNVMDFLNAMGDVIKLRNTGREIRILPLIETACQNVSTEDVSQTADQLANDMESLFVSKDAESKVDDNSNLIGESEKSWSWEELKALAEESNTLPNLRSNDDQVIVDEAENNRFNCCQDSGLMTDCQNLKSTSPTGSIPPDQIRTVEENLGDLENLTESKIFESFPQEIFKMLLQVICSACNGIAVNCVPEMFEEFHEEVLRLPENLGSLEPFFLNMPSYFEVKETNGLKTVRATAKAANWLNSIVFGTATSTDDKIQEDLAMLCTEIPEPQLPCSILVGSTNEVLISCVLHPDKFWIQLVECLPKLNDLTMEMKTVYDDLTISQKYAVPKESISFHLNCAAYYEKDKSWKRAMIINFDSTTQIVEVRFVDFGNGAKIISSNLRYLKKEFADIPVLCFQSKMANILNKDKVKWSLRVQKIFESLCLKKTFLVQFLKIEPPLILKFSDDLKIFEKLDEKTQIKPPDSTTSGKVYLNDMSEMQTEIVTSEQVSPNIISEKLKKYEEKEDRIFTSSPILNKENIDINWLSTTTMDAIGKPSHKSRAFLFAETIKAGNSDEILNKECPGKLELIKSSDIQRASEVEVKVSYNKWKPKIEDVNLQKKLKNNWVPCTSVIQNLDLEYQILPTQLLGKPIHIIHLSGENYLQDFEVSSFLWKANILNQMANAANINMKIIVITPSSHPNLFDDLYRFRSENHKTSISEICIMPLQVVVAAIPQIIFRRENDIRPLLSFLSMFKN